MLESPHFKSEVSLSVMVWRSKAPRSLFGSFHPKVYFFPNCSIVHIVFLISAVHPGCGHMLMNVIACLFVLCS